MSLNLIFSEDGIGGTIDSSSYKD